MKASFSVITPCYNANRWIRSCVASVADQQAVSVEHIVQDGLSNDGTAEYLRSERRVQAEIAKDEGMYDAINKGWAKCKGEFVVHLNADEELLPGALEAVSLYFQGHPEIDVVLGGTLICEADGTLNCFRKPIRPSLGILLTSHHPVPSCAVFLRRSSFAERKFLYDPRFRIISDVLLMIDIMQERKAVATLHRYTSVFLKTGSNMGLTQSEIARREYQYQMSLAKGWQKILRPLIKMGFLLQKLVRGHYFQATLPYDIYLPGAEHKRQRLVALKPSGIYRPEQTKAFPS